MDNIKDKTHKVAVNNLGNKQSMTNINTPQLDEITYGIDKGAPNGDYTALSIRRGTKLFIFVGGEAEIIIDLLALKDIEHAKALELAKIEVKIEAYTATEMVCNKVKYSRSVDIFIDERLSELSKQKNLLTKESK